MTLGTFPVRRTGNSLAIVLPRTLARELRLREGDHVEMEVRKIPSFLELFGRLKGVLTAEEFTRLSNEGEDLA